MARRRSRNNASAQAAQAASPVPIANYNPVLQNLYTSPTPQPQTPSASPQIMQQTGPLQGLSSLNNMAQQGTGQSSIPIPQATAQNTALPQGQVLSRSGRQRGGIGKFFLGSRPQVFNSPNFTPFQSEVLNYLLQYGLGGLQDLDQNQFDFAPIGNQELERFYTQTVPTLAERFTAMGGGQRSSAFQGALANAGRFLGNDLAAQQQQYNLQGQGMEQNLISNLLNLGLTPQFSQNLKTGNGGLLGGLVGAGTQVAKGLV